MEIFSFQDLDEKHRELNLRNLRFYYFIVGFVLAIFMAKFVIKYKYANYLPLYIFLYVTNMIIYPIVKYFTNNVFKSLWAFYVSVTITLDILLYMSGGLRAPGNIWLSLFPFFGASILGRRGFFWGLIFVTITFIILLFLKISGNEMYPFASTESFQFEFTVNLMLFTAVSFYYTYFYVRSEVEFQKRIQDEKEKNENLLRILFHDLANPMQTIRMLVKKSQKSLNSNSFEEQPKIISQIDKTTLRIVEILDHVRQMKAIEDGKININIRSINLYESLLKIEEIFDERLKEKQIHLSIDPNSNRSVLISVDPVYFTNQVIANLISNSIKFSEPNSTISISWIVDRQNVFLKVKDQGIGIPSETLPKVFEQNMGNSRRGTAGEMGTGYGMPLVKTFVEHFDGTIQIESVEKIKDSINHGTTVTISLPNFSN